MFRVCLISFPTHFLHFVNTEAKITKCMSAYHPIVVWLSWQMRMAENYPAWVTQRVTQPECIILHSSSLCHNYSHSSNLLIQEVQLSAMPSICHLTVMVADGIDTNLSLNLRCLVLSTWYCIVPFLSAFTITPTAIHFFLLIQVVELSVAGEHNYVLITG